MDEKSTKDGEGFVARWSRRKTEVKEKLQDQSIGDLKEEETSALGEIAAPEPVDDEKNIVEELPDIETLDGKSDYTPFLKDGVPEKLKRLALRKLWTSNPAFGFLDGLDDYDEDFSAIGIVAQEVFTNYNPGKGFIDPEEEIEETLQVDKKTGQKEDTQELSKPEGEKVEDEDKKKSIEETPSETDEILVSDKDDFVEEDREKLEASSKGKKA